MIVNVGCVLFCREYIDKNIVQFAKDNPGISVYVMERSGKHPTITGHFSKLLVAVIGNERQSIANQ